MGATARDWMSEAPSTVPHTAPVAELAALFSSNRVSSVPVVDQGRVIGVVSRSDLVSVVACEHNLADSMLDDLSIPEAETSEERAAQIAEFVWRRMEGKTVGQLMTAAPITVQAEQPLEEVARCLVEHRIHHLPVLDGTELVGVISTFDLARWIAS